MSRGETEASRTRGYCVAPSATGRAARPGPSLRKKTLAQDDKQCIPGQMLLSRPILDPDRRAHKAEGVTDLIL